MCRLIFSIKFGGILAIISSSILAASFSLVFLQTPNMHLLVNFHFLIKFFYAGIRTPIDLFLQIKSLGYDSDIASFDKYG